MTVKYFAYGSNMAPDVINVLCPKCQYVGAARLDGFRLAFTRRSIRSGTGVADVVEDTDQEVWGTLYDIDDEGLARIDRKEGSDWAYQRQPVQVALADGSLHDAITYTVVEKEPAEVPPSAPYLHGLIRAAHQRDLPPAYLAILDSLPARLGAREAVVGAPLDPKP